MKTEFFKTTYATYFWYDGSSILEQYWTNENGKMTDKEFQKEMWNYLRFVEEKRPPLALVDLRQFFFMIPNELQEWVDKNINNPAGKIIEKVAFVMPPGFVERLSVELTMEEPEAKKAGGIAYFSNQQEAMDWLLSR